MAKYSLVVDRYNQGQLLGSDGALNVEQLRERAGPELKPKAVRAAFKRKWPLDHARSIRLGRLDRSSQLSYISCLSNCFCNGSVMKFDVSHYEVSHLG
jgi:hypothetical protein